MLKSNLKVGENSVNSCYLILKGLSVSRDFIISFWDTFTFIATRCCDNWNNCWACGCW